MEGLTVRTRRAAREAVATYERDEAEMEIRVTLPASFPLTGAAVEATKQQGVKAAQMRKWLLASNACLMQVNSSCVNRVQMTECLRFLLVRVSFEAPLSAFQSVPCTPSKHVFTVQ